MVCLFIVFPVQSMTIKTLDISVQNNRDAIIQFNYELNWVENTAVFAKIVDPSEELKSALEKYTGLAVDNVKVTNDGVQVTIHKFTTETINGNAVTMKTPVLSFNRAEQVLNQYWFAPLISVDLSPELTTVSFPDKYEEKFVNEIRIPSVTHTVFYG